MATKRKKHKVIKIIIDTNIIFSALLNTNGTIGDLLFNSYNHFEFYSCSYMRYEIEKHREKLKRISKLSDTELEEARFKIFDQINFINEELIPAKTWLAAEEITKEIDIDDSDFVALTKYLKGYLWTGDKELYNGLTKKNFKSVFNTSELIALRKAKK
ncbi:MAG: PIN domain-containing protein [Bacteroidia bacterium]